jgi:predicted acetyltransferase
MQPTVVVRDSWLAAERADCARQGSSTELLDRATEDFGQIVAERQGTRTWWAVPTTVLWYISGEHYLGEFVIRHELTPALTESGGHTGYSVALPWRRQGHATRMLAAGLSECRRLGFRRVLLTIDVDNEPSRRVALANGAVPDGRANGEDRFWITVDDSSRARPACSRDRRASRWPDSPSGSGPTATPVTPSARAATTSARTWITPRSTTRWPVPS